MRGLGCVPTQQESRTQTLETIERALKTVSVGMDATAAGIKGAAQQLSDDMSDDGGRVLTDEQAEYIEDLLDGGETLAHGAGAISAVVTISQGLADHDSPNYIAGDVITRAASTAGGAALGAALCPELGPGDLGCALVGAIGGFIAASSANVVYQYVFGPG